MLRRPQVVVIACFWCSEAALGNPLCLRALRVENLPATDKVEDNVEGLGWWGGRCTCPSGAEYLVGDNGDFCGSLACFGGGVSGACQQAKGGGWAGRRVTCEPPPLTTLLITQGRGGKTVARTPNSESRTLSPAWPTPLCIAEDDAAGFQLCFELHSTGTRQPVATLHVCLEEPAAVLPAGPRSLELQGLEKSGQAPSLHFHVVAFEPPVPPAPPAPPSPPRMPPPLPLYPRLQDFPTVETIATTASGLTELLDRFRGARSIAVIGSSGNLLYRNYGAEIDRHDAVIRINGATTAGYACMHACTHACMSGCTRTPRHTV